MPVKKAAKKAYSRSVKLREVNLLHKLAMKKAVKELKKAVAKQENAQELLVKAYSLIDKASKHNIVHKNNAARKKSRLTKFVAKAAGK
ncbi:MAG: 30S ribosomal protein S20 [bacterium]